MFDAIVLGAGVVGVSAAWHLLRRGKSVALIDRREPGEETSHGNAGVVERDGFLPMSFPQRLGDLLRYGLNREPELHYHPGFLPTVAPFLMAMRRAWHPSSSVPSRSTAFLRRRPAPTLSSATPAGSGSIGARRASSPARRRAISPTVTAPAIASSSR